MSAHEFFSRATALALVLGFASPLRAQEGIPPHFVDSDECMSRDCTCADTPMMEVFLNNQRNAREAWKSVREAILMPGGPQSMEEAVALFNSRFSGDPRVSAQFMSCDGYDPNVNSLSKIAGVPGIGQAALDPCFCNAFCKDIVEATVNHELTHAPTLLMGFANVAHFKVACKAGVLPDGFCNTLDPLILADSELISYSVGNATLDNAIDRLRERDPENPEMECTWKPLPPAPSSSQQAEPAPEGFWARLQLLAQRFWSGATSRAP